MHARLCPVGRSRPSPRCYRTPEGFRAADAPSTGADSLVPPPVSISALMDTATPGLPDTLDFLFRPYKVHYSVDYLARPTVGYTRQSFGGGFYGGSTVVLGDMLGDHNLVFSGYVNGQIGESMVLAEYINRTQPAELGNQHRTDAVLQPAAQHDHLRLSGPRGRRPTSRMSAG